MQLSVATRLSACAKRLGAQVCKKDVNKLTVTYRLNLLENALSSFEEALLRYKQGRQEDVKHFKFCISYLSHFVELYMKYCVSQLHPLLIFKFPAKSLKGALTISLDDAIIILQNAGLSISRQFSEDLKWLKKLRNEIEHFEFTIDESIANDYIGRILSGVIDFNAERSDIDIIEFFKSIEDKLDIKWEDLESLSSLYKLRLKRAEQSVAKACSDAYSGLRPKEYGLINWSSIECQTCGHETMIPNENSMSGWKCEFCDETEPDRDIAEGYCGICTAQWPLSGLQPHHIGEDETVMACGYCRHDPEYFRDE